MQPFIRVSQLKQSFGAQEVLKGVSFDVDKGELCARLAEADYHYHSDRNQFL